MVSTLAIIFSIVLYKLKLVQHSVPRKLSGSVNGWVHCRWLCPVSQPWAPGCPSHLDPTSPFQDRACGHSENTAVTLRSLGLPEGALLSGTLPSVSSQLSFPANPVPSVGFAYRCPWGQLKGRGWGQQPMLGGPTSQEHRWWDNGPVESGFYSSATSSELCLCSCASGAGRGASGVWGLLGSPHSDSSSPGAGPI